MSLRSQYEQAVRDLREHAAEMRRRGASAEAIARAMHAERRRLASLFKEQTPEPHRTRIYERTLRVYGNEIGPSIESPARDGQIVGGDHRERDASGAARRVRTRTGECRVGRG